MGSFYRWRFEIQDVWLTQCDGRPDNFADHMVDEKIAISEYSLSASVACGKVRCPCHLGRFSVLHLR